MAYESVGLHCFPRGTRGDQGISFLLSQILLSRPSEWGSLHSSNSHDRSTTGSHAPSLQVPAQSHFPYEHHHTKHKRMLLNPKLTITPDPVNASRLDCSRKCGLAYARCCIGGLSVDNWRRANVFASAQQADPRRQRLETAKTAFVCRSDSNRWY